MADPSFPVAPAAVALPTLALVTLVLDIGPLAWHIRNHNLAASSLVSWTILSNLMNMINAFIWPTDDIASWWNGSVLCDIEAKLMIAVTFGLVGSLVCIMRSLAQVLDTRRTVLSPSRAERHWQIVHDCLYCFGGPIYVMAIHYVVQPNRYYIFAISGCTASSDNSWPKLVLWLIWPPILCIVAVYYSVLVIIRMRRYRRDFSEVLGSSNSNMTKSRFLRLFILSITLIVVVLPTQFYILYRNSTVPLLPYSWNAVHGPEWWDIGFFPIGGTVIFDRWIQIGIGFALFPFFGLGQDAQKMYRKALLKIGFGKIFPSLRRRTSTSPRQGSPTSSHTRSFGSRARLFFHKRGSEGSIFSLHSQRSSVPSSVATLSPAEAHKRFNNLPTISEGEHQNYNSPGSPILERSSPPASTNVRKSWLDRFRVKTHSSAPLRQESTTGFGDLPGSSQLGVNAQYTTLQLYGSDLEK